MRNYVWPLSNETTSDSLNTSFGPRVNADQWDFHDGLDLPAPVGTAIHAMCSGVVHLAGDGASNGYSSRHVVIEVDDADDGPLFNVYLHLASIDPAVALGASVTQGQVIGTVGDDAAHYPHLHMEFRRGSATERSSVHPLSYLPYFDSASFTAPVASGFNRLGGFMAARLSFSAPDRNEGDLKCVEVDLMHDSTQLSRRVVDFNDKGTINEGNADRLLYVNDIGVEGYQKSNMIGDARADLRYAVLVRRLPTKCNALVARVIDVGNNVVQGGSIAVPAQSAVDEFVDFEDGAMPPSGWIKLTSASGSRTTVVNSISGAHAGSRCMRCHDASTSEDNSQRAAIQYSLPAGRFEWRVEGWFNPAAVDLTAGQSVYLLHFLSGPQLSVAARVHREDGALRVGLIARHLGSELRSKDGSAQLAVNSWRKWRLELLRIGTRETTAILYLTLVQDSSKELGQLVM